MFVTFQCPRDNQSPVADRIPSRRFAFLGITPEQVEKLVKEHHEYLTKVCFERDVTFGLRLVYFDSATGRPHFRCWCHALQRQALGCM